MQLKARIIELLQKVGLTPAEAKFYLAVQKNSQLTLSQIQKETGLSRASVYRSFEKLHGLKLVTSSQDNWRKNIQAVSLNFLASNLAKEQRKLRKIELELKKVNNLMTFSNNSYATEPVELLTEPNQIIEKCFQILQKPLNNFCCYGSAERLIDVIGKDPEHEFVKIRSRKGKKVNCVLTEIGEYTKEFIPHNERDLRNMKLKINPSMNNYVTYLYDNEATIWLNDKDLGKRAIVIKDPVLIKIQQQFFQQLWNN